MVKPESAALVRASISFPPDVYEELVNEELVKTCVAEASIAGLGRSRCGRAARRRAKEAIRREIRFFAEELAEKRA